MDASNNMYTYDMPRKAPFPFPVKCMDLHNHAWTIATYPWLPHGRKQRWRAARRAAGYKTVLWSDGQVSIL